MDQEYEDQDRLPRFVRNCGGQLGWFNTTEAHTELQFDATTGEACEERRPDSGTSKAFSYLRHF